MGRAMATLGVLFFLGAREARSSEPMPTRASRLDSPGRNTASEDSAESLALNPANLAFLPAAELRWTGVRCPETNKVNCGHAFDAATPLPFDLTTGVRVDYVMPPSTAGFPFEGMDYTWITWGLGYRISDALAIGMSLQRSYSPNSFTDGLFGITAGISARPDTHLALSFVAHDFNGPSPELLPPRNLPVLDRSYVLSMALRPTGRRALEIGLDLKCIEGTNLNCLSNTGILPRATLGIDIPRFGRARGDFEVSQLPNDSRRGVVGTAGFEFTLGSVSLGGGAIFGSGLGGPDDVAEYATAAISAYSQPNRPKLARAVYFRIEHTPDVRGHMALLRKLWKVAEDHETEAVALVLRAEPADSLAHAEEIADAIRYIRAHKKKVLCSWEDAGSRSLYVCANADRTVVNPAGGLRYAGLRSQYIYLGGLLKKLGVNAEFVRISDHKSAPEQFTNEHASEVSRADHEDLLRESEAVFTKDVAVGRHASEAHVREVTAHGPFTAGEARDAGLVDGTAFDDELERVTGELLGHHVSYQRYEEETEAPPQFGPRSKVAVVVIDGDMVDGRSSHIPLIDMNLIGSYSVADTIRSLKDDPTVKSVVLRIESGGGSSMAADVMWRAIEQLAEKKPLIVSMGSMAASGGYYIAAPARTIYALPLTLTGSIGIFYGKADLTGLLQKIGVTVDTYKTTPRADAESLFRPFTEDERQALTVKIHQFYDTFLDRVSRGRHMTKAQVDLVGQGRVWTGQEAWQRGLVDKMGGLRHALAEARLLGNLPDDAPVVEVPQVDKSLIEKAFDLVGVRVQASAFEALPAQVKDMARAVAPMAVYAPDVPLARIEWAPLDGQ